MWALQASEPRSRAYLQNMAPNVLFWFKRVENDVKNTEQPCKY